MRLFGLFTQGAPLRDDPGLWSCTPIGVRCLFFRGFIINNYLSLDVQLNTIIARSLAIWLHTLARVAAARILSANPPFEYCTARFRIGTRRLELRRVVRGGLIAPNPLFEDCARGSGCF